MNILLLIFRVLFFLLGTFLHELAHFAMALIFGRVNSFSIIPKIENGLITFGEVNASVKLGILHLPIAIAPLIWWVVLAFFATSGYANTLPPVLFYFLCWQLVWAGKLSIQDVKVAIYALLSWSGLFLISAIIGVIFFLKTQ